MNVLDRWFDVERKKYGSADHYFKGFTFGSKARAFYSRPFCPRYAESFTTTVYPDTFFALKKKHDPVSCVETEFHENVHKCDRHDEGVLFTLKYAWPHYMSVPFLIAVTVLSGILGVLGIGVFIALLHAGLVTLALSDKHGKVSRSASIAFYVLVSIGLVSYILGTIIGGGWFSLLWLGAILFASPWPIKPVWRRDYEIRGYTMTLYSSWKKYEYILDEKWFSSSVDWCIRAFTGPAYMYMERDGELVRREFLYQVGRFREDEESFLRYWSWSKDPRDKSMSMAEPYRMAKDFIISESFYDGFGKTVRQ